MAASGGAWTPPVLRSAHEFAAQPEWARTLGSYAAPHRSLAASAFCLSSLSPAPHGRRHLRQEPDAGNPPVRIRGGGREQSRSLLRLIVGPLPLSKAYVYPA